MSTHVLVPMDYSEGSRHALERALTDLPDAEVTVLHVVDFRSSDLGPGGFGTANAWEDWYEAAEAHAEKLLDEAHDIAAEHDRDVATATVVGEDTRSILDYIDEHDVDHVYIGSHGRSGIERILLGSVAETIVRRAPVPVTVVR
jgi:nucleotide-binding universal stress UspA family protein